MDEEKDRLVMTMETLKNMLECFSDSHELNSFMKRLIGLCAYSIRKYAEMDEEEALPLDVCLVLFQLSLFIRRDFDIIQSLCKACTFSMKSMDEVQGMIDQGDKIFRMEIPQDGHEPG